MFKKVRIDFVNTFVPANTHILKKFPSETFQPITGIAVIKEELISGGEIKRNQRLVYGNDRLADLLNDALIKGKCGILGLALSK